MKTYETIAVIDAHQSEETIDSLINKIKKMITDNGGNIIDVNRWGKRRLAYEIKKKQHGYYVYFLYEIDKGEFPKVLEHNFRISEKMLRYLTLRLDKKVIELKVKKKNEEIEKTLNKDSNKKVEEEKIVEESK